MYNKNITITTFPASEMTVADILDWFGNLDGCPEKAYLTTENGINRYKFSYDGNDYHLREIQGTSGLVTRAIAAHETINIGGLVCKIKPHGFYHEGC